MLVLLALSNTFHMKHAAKCLINTDVNKIFQILKSVSWRENNEVFRPSQEWSIFFLYFVYSSPFVELHAQLHLKYFTFTFSNSFLFIIKVI